MSKGKTNAARILERLGVEFDLVDYPVDEDDLSAERAALVLDMEPAAVFKTLVVRGDRTGVMLAIVPAGHVLDLKALARLSGDRKVEMVRLEEVERLTGYVRGAVTALGTKKRYPVYADASIERPERIGVSAGARGKELKLDPAAYLRAVGAKVGRIANQRNPK